MAKDSFKINMEDKRAGSEMTAADFNQIKGQHNKYTDSVLLKDQVVTSLGEETNVTPTQKVTTDALALKFGSDNVATGEGSSTTKTMNQAEVTKVLQKYQDNEEFLDDQGYWERSKLHPKQLGAQGLKFKAGDNTVFAKTMKALVLGTDDFTVCVVARTEGCGESPYPLLGFTKQDFSANSFKIVKGGTGINGIYDVRFEGARSNVVNVLKTDNTTNLHHIVITRSGTLVTVTINGRLVKSGTQDRVLDFSNFIYDIANTSYFYGGAVFNYAMTQDESNKLLWNGGRYDEVRLPYHMVDKNNIVTLRTPTIVPNADNPQNAVISNASIGNFQLSFSGGADAGRPSINVAEVPRININNYFNIEFDYECISDTAMLSQISGSYNINHSFTRGTGKVKLVVKSDGQAYIYFRFNGTVATNIKISNIKISIQSALLEYRPENIREDRYLNSGTAGSDYDLVYSSVKPNIIYDKPYQDLTIQNTNPTHHPIAVGQQVIIPDGNIYTAVEPPMNREWSPEDFKLTATP